MALAGYSGLRAWTDQLNLRLRARLLARLDRALADWTAAFTSAGAAAGAADGSALAAAPAGAAPAAGGSARDGGGGGLLSLPLRSHSLELRGGQLLALEPPLEAARADWLARLSRVLRVATGLPRLASGRYDQLKVSGPAGQAVPILLLVCWPPPNGRAPT